MKVTDKKFLNVHQTLGPLSVTTTNTTAANNNNNNTVKAVLNAFGQVCIIHCICKVMSSTTMATFLMHISS